MYADHVGLKSRTDQVCNRGANEASLGFVPRETRYAKRADGAHIAYQISGDGPLSVVVVPGFVSHVELVWEVPLFVGPFLRWLGRFARVIHLAKRGTGLSDRAIGAPSLEQRIDEVRAVMDATGCERAAPIGISGVGLLNSAMVGGELLDRHDAVMCRQRERFRGREIKATGDGFFAAFDGPARAVMCPGCMRRGPFTRPQPPGGVHTGECEQRQGDLGGIAVHGGAPYLFIG